ncbi:O-antigen ligase family protein [Microbacterium sp. 22303]|uniref:O-antigen ligase family protein n=1 Tax=Microbacterium sp. 22303 TaxID=3453905 RepID=UPI003F84BC6D
MSIEIVFAIVVAVVVITIAATVFKRATGFMASMMWGMFPVYGALLPAGGGLVALLGALGLIALIVRTRTKATPIGLGILLLALAFGVGVVVREWIDPPSQTGAVGIQLVVSILAAGLLAYVGTAVEWKAGFAFGLLPGGLTLTVAEVIRVLSGGVIHAQEAAFGVNPIVLAQYAGIAAMVPIYQVARRAWSWWNIIFALVAITGVVATASRGPLLGVAAAVMYLIVRGDGHSAGGWKRFQRLIVMVVASAFVLVSVVLLRVDIGGWFRLDDSDRNASTRVDGWTASWSTIESNWVFGAGPGRYANSDYGANLSLPDYPHNIWLETWSEFGILLVVIAVAIVVMSWRTASGIGTSFIVFGVIAFGLSGSLLSSLVFWISIGLAVSTSAHGRLSLSDSSDATSPYVKES